MANKDIISPAVTDVQTLKEVISCLEKNTPIKTQGNCGQKTIFEILVKAASEKDSIENICKSIENAPSANNVRYHLEKYKSIDTLEIDLNKTLQSKVPEKIKNCKQKIAIDLNLIPYYGKPSEAEKPYIYRSQAKDGTCSFYAYATVYLLKKNKRFTLALLSVRRDETLVAIVTKLLSLTDLDIKCLYLDRGFCCTPVIRWLTALDIAFVMPMMFRGRKNSKSQKILSANRSYKTTYQTSSQKYGSIIFSLWVVCSYANGRHKRRGIERYVFVVYGVKTKLRSIHNHYRKRFGIEASYRMKNICLIKTTTKNPAIRLLFIAIAFLLVNLWAYILWDRVSSRQKGGRIVYAKLFPLKRMLAFLRSALEKIYPLIQEVFLPT